MADEWKYKDLPRAANGIAPAKWNPDTGEFEVYTGVNDVKAIGVEDRLTAIENKLDSVIQNGSVNTQVTGSKVELSNVSDVEIAPGSEFRYKNGSGSDIFDMTDYRQFVVGFWADGNKEVKILERQRFFNFVGQTSWEEVFSSSKYAETSPYIDVTAPYLSVAVRNDGIDEVTYRLSLLGVK